MTYNKMLELKTILLDLFNKKIIDVRAYLEMQNSLDNYTLVEDFLIECINKYDIKYKDYPQDYRANLDFLRKVISVRPSLEKEIKKSQPRVYNALFTNLPVNEHFVVSNLEDGSRIRKINVFSSKQVG